MVYIVTYGCKVNQYESLQIANATNGVMLNESDLSKIKNAMLNKNEQDLTFYVNSCAVTSMAEKKSRYGVSKIKKLFPNAKIIPVGCAFGKPKIEEIVKLKNEPTIHRRERAFIKVQDGCKNFCSYCIIPYIRNKITCREISDIVAEITAQPDYVKEIIISGINLCYYPNFAELCIAVNKCGRKFSISSLEPILITENLCRKLQSCKNFLPNFHICLQSGCNKVLKSMNRHYTAEEYYKKLETVRKYFPNAKITTDLIVGFPTETEEDFNQTYAFVQRCNFAKIHLFPYSPRKGTSSYSLKPITNSVVTDRMNKFCLNNK
jgi:threonylcarbamoyladenosine tRNA methylthiotransferase MtaB